ncbi:MAG TPA: replication-relaxation family protein [Acidimicrobiales bacterium]|nr:replication-relaxation family protein [Acidimicrobiales bacterium]
MRGYLNAARLDRLAATLSDREVAILETLDRVRLASGAQLGRLHFTGDSVRHRRRVLESLATRQLVHRLDRVVGGRRAGSSGFLYVLAVPGQRLLSRATGRPVRRPTEPGGPFIRHIMLVTELYVGLVEAERHGRIELLDFQAEPAAWRRYPGSGGGTVVLKPDACVRVGIGPWADAWMVEVDRGTESPLTLVRKADAIRRYAGSGLEQRRHGVFPKVLWTVPSERRKTTLVNAISTQPAESWRLHQVTLYSQAIATLTGGQP